MAIEDAPDIESRSPGGPADVAPPSGPARRRPGRLGLVLAAVAMVAGVGGVVLAGRLSGPRGQVVGGNLPVDAGATDPLDTGAHNSPTVVANPEDPANLAVVDRVDSPVPSCALHGSFDRGATWKATPIPSPGERVTPCFTPDLAFGADGALYVSFTSFAQRENAGTAPDAVWVSASHDGGRTLSAPVQATGPLAFQARLAADPSEPGRLWVTWLQASELGSWGFSKDGAPILVSRSDDGGATWAAPVTVNPSRRQRVVAPSLATGPKGALYAAYLDVGGDRLDYAGAHEGRGGDPYAGKWALVVARSGDGGRTWREAVVDAGVVPTQRFLQLYPPTPSLAVDRRSGRVHVGFHDGRMGDADVAVWSSPDGVRWGRRRRVNNTAEHDGRSQYLPQLAVAPSGRLDVVYYDRRRDPGDHFNEVSLQSSFDGGATFGPRLALSDRPFDARIGVGRNRDLPDLGSRLGLVASDGGALAVWADTRAATGQVDKQVLARAVVSFSRGSSVRRPLRTGGWALAAGGLAGLALAIRNRRRRIVPAALPRQVSAPDPLA